MGKGYIKLSRSFFDNEIWQAARAFSECEAWLDLIQSARFEASPTTSRIGVYEVTWGRGQYPASVRFLAKKWGRSEQWVRTLIGKLKRKGMVSVDNSQGTSVITLLNYEKYNGVDEPQVNTPDNTPCNTLNNVQINELQEFVTHLVTQQLTHLVEKQHTPNTNNKKGKEYSRRLTSTPEENNNPKKETSPDGEAKKDGLSLAETDKCKIDYQALMDYYNATFQGKLPGIKAMTDTRKKAVKARVAQYGKDAVMQVFSNVLDSPFLLGDNDRNWTADFDWIFKPANFTKILERRYNGKRSDTNQKRRESRKILNGLAAEILAADAAKDGF